VGPGVLLDFMLRLWDARKLKGEMDHQSHGQGIGSRNLSKIWKKTKKKIAKRFLKFEKS